MRVSVFMCVCVWKLFSTSFISTPHESLNNNMTFPNSWYLLPQRPGHERLIVYALYAHSIFPYHLSLLIKNDMPYVVKPLGVNHYM